MKLTDVVQVVRKVGKLSKRYSNFPDRYIKRAMEQVEFRNPKGPQYRPGAVIQRTKFKFTVNRPWTQSFYEENAPGINHAKIFVEPLKDWNFFKGDRVEVLVGKDKGKQGYVKQIFDERNWITVEGLNCKLIKAPAKEGVPPTYIQEEQPLLVTNEVALVDPSDLVATPVEWRYTEEGKRVRVSARTGRIIPIPAAAEETIDYKSKLLYKEEPKDTLADDVTEVTFEPALKTFEMDIMEQMGIKEDRVPPKTYWY